MILQTYLAIAAVVGLLTAYEQSHRFSQAWGVGIDDVLLGFMLGAIAGAAWPLTILVFLCNHERPNTALMCTLSGGHKWRTIGGISFRGKGGICPDGSQSLWCMRCPSRKRVWPWGDEQFSSDETFGYSPTPRDSVGLMIKGRYSGLTPIKPEKRRTTLR